MFSESIFVAESIRIVAYVLTTPVLVSLVFTEFPKASLSFLVSHTDFAFLAF